MSWKRDRPCPHCAELEAQVDALQRDISIMMKTTLKGRGTARLVAESACRLRLVNDVGGPSKTYTLCSGDTLDVMTQWTSLLK